MTTSTETTDMCRSVCEQIYGWFHADPTVALIGSLFIVVTLFRLAVRGRWPTIFVMFAGWIVVAAVILWVLP